MVRGAGALPPGCRPHLILLPKQAHLAVGHHLQPCERWPCANTCRHSRFNWGKWLAKPKPWRRLVEHQGIAPCIPVWKTGVYLSTPMLERNWNLRIRFVHWSFCRIGRVLPDAACRRFHAIRPKPQLRKPAWLPFYTGGDASLQLVLSAFIFRLPCGQQRSITPPCESNRPLPSLRDNRRPDCAEALRD